MHVQLKSSPGYNETETIFFINIAYTFVSHISTLCLLVKT